MSAYRRMDEAGTSGHSGPRWALNRRMSAVSTSVGQARMSRTSSLQIHPLLKLDQGALDLVDALS